MSLGNVRIIKHEEDFYDILYDGTGVEQDHEKQMIALVRFLDDVTDVLSRLKYKISYGDKFNWIRINEKIKNKEAKESV